MADIPVEGKIKPLLVGGKVADAIDVETTGDFGSELQTVLNNISDLVFRQTFDNTVANDPPSNSFRRNTADRTTVTEIYVDLNWNEGTFNEFLLDLPAGSYVYQQSITTPANNVLYRTTARATAGTGSSWFNIPVSYLRSEGDEFTDGDDVSFRFLPGLQTGTTTSRELILPFTFNQDLIIVQGNIDRALTAPLYYAAGNDRTDVELIFRVAGLTQDSSGNALSYPLEFIVGHTGGTSRLLGNNTFTVQFQDQNNANAIIQMRVGSGSPINTLTLFQSDVYAFRVDSTTDSEIAVVRTSTIDPRAVAQFDLNADVTVDATNNTTFTNSFAGNIPPEVPEQGEQYLVRVGGHPFDNVEVDAGDVMESLASPPDFADVNDWAIIRRALSHPVTALESRFLGGVSETSSVSKGVNYADSAGEIRIQLYDIGGYTPADLNNNGQIDQYSNTANQFNQVIAIRFNNTQAQLTNVLPRLYVDVLSPDGVDRRVFNLSTDFTFQGDFGAESDWLSDTTFNYRADQIIRIFETQNINSYAISNFNAIPNIPDGGINEDKLDPVLANIINADQGITHVDRERLDDIEVTESSTAIDGTLTFKSKLGPPTANDDDYEQNTANDGTDFDTGIVPEVGDSGSDLHTIRVADEVTVTSATNTAQGTISVTEIPSLFRGERMYTLTVNRVADPTTEIVTLVGTVHTRTPSGLDSSIKIDVDNLDDALLQDLRRSSNSELTPAFQDLENHLTVDYVTGNWRAADNPTQHNGVLTRLFAAYWDENRRGTSPFTGNYFDDLADPVITLNAGVNVDGAPLTNNFNIIISFSHYIVSENFSTEVPLIKAGARRILGIDENGLHARQGNRDGASRSISVSTRLFSGTTGQGNSIQYLQGVGANTVSYFVPDTITFPETFDILFKTVEANGHVGPQTDLEYTITDRAVAQAQNSQTVAVNLPTPPGGTRDETITTEYNATTNQLIIGTPGLSQNTTQDVTHLGMEVAYDVDQQINDSTTNTNIRFHEQDEHTGRTVDIVLMIEEQFPNSNEVDKLLEIKAVVNGFQENNMSLHWRESNFDFSDIQFGPNTQFTNYFYADANDPDNVLFPGKQSYASDGDVSIANIQIYSWDDLGSPFNAPLHADLYRFWQNRDHWFGLFVSSAEDYRRYIINGGLSITDESSNEINLIDRHETNTPQLAAAVPTNLVSSVVLPTDYLTYDFVFVSQRSAGPPIEWRNVLITVESLAYVGTDLIRIQGDSDLTWTIGTRTLAVSGGATELYMVRLFRI